ncbi:MAG: membrane protein insertase YidC [Actinomycetota bacterium]|nr:membrane protein insertase YidC [Actinomycetota bacterium]
MFNFILSPVSAILWFWHLLFGSLFGADNGAGWALAILFLVFTVRALLIRPALRQLRSMQTARKLGPQLSRLRQRYAGDRQRLAREIQQLHADNGSSMLGGLLPALLQIPVFLSLNAVLRGFTPTAQRNHIFDRTGVESFLHADFFGAKLGNWPGQPAATLAHFGTNRSDMLAAGLPLMLLAGIATYLTMRLSMSRQQRLGSGGDQPPGSRRLNRILMYLAPAGVLICGSLFPMPIGMLLYFLATNLWTLGQTHVLGTIVDREQQRLREPQERAAATRQRASRPKPGQRPQRR